MLVRLFYIDFGRTCRSSKARRRTSFDIILLSHWPSSFGFAARCGGADTVGAIPMLIKDKTFGLFLSFRRRSAWGSRDFPA
jgi:hypothetical protein